jgi:hypothetical protein
MMPLRHRAICHSLVTTGSEYPSDPEMDQAAGRIDR